MLLYIRVSRVFVNVEPLIVLHFLSHFTLPSALSPVTYEHL